MDFTPKTSLVGFALSMRTSLILPIVAGPLVFCFVVIFDLGAFANELVMSSEDACKQVVRTSTLCSYPEHLQAAAVKEKDLTLLEVTVQLGSAKVLPRLEELERIAPEALTKIKIERIEA